MTKHTKRRIRKAFMLTRTIFLVMSFVFIFAAAICDGSNLVMPIMFFVAAVTCFCISYFLDYLLGDKQSPFYH